MVGTKGVRTGVLRPSTTDPATPVPGGVARRWTHEGPLQVDVGVDRRYVTHAVSPVQGPFSEEASEDGTDTGDHETRDLGELFIVYRRNYKRGQNLYLNFFFSVEIFSTIFWKILEKEL